MTRLLILSTALWVSTNCLPALADTEPQLDVRVTAESEIRILDETGSEVQKRIPATTVVPGDEVIYTISCTNTGTDLAEDVFVTNAIPQHMLFKSTNDLSKTPSLTFSVDGGVTYAAPDELRVLDEEGNPRPADAVDYTHLRWTLSGDLAPGSSEKLSYRAQLQ